MKREVVMPDGWKVTLRVEPEYPGELIVFIENENTGQMVVEHDTRGDDGPGWVSSYSMRGVEDGS